MLHTSTATLLPPPFPRPADGTELRASRVVLAVGHSARDMYRCLARHDVAITPKPFAMGFRIEHPQALIDRLQYGEEDAAGEQGWGALATIPLKYQCRSVTYGAWQSKAGGGS